ncbi:winged helix DNA-binding domain-containing protein [Amycolatopsis ruanii]|uniref:winged helix DNA-binding domain-containing protein n=1 Tax=Amycolatopsis ruanii TaxID=944491 RepID=UPI000E267F3C|nr:winged helix DNA-binding domain-containing protein [Amycolatopsis ruanii]
MDVRRRRVAAQLLDRTAGTTLVGAVRHLLAVQAQEPAAFPLALRARVPGLTGAEVDTARHDRTLVRCWGPRGTLHLIARDDLPWLYPLVKPNPANSLRRLEELGVDNPDGSRAAAALDGQGPLAKAELGERTGTEGQATVHLAMLAAERGLVVLGPERRGKPTYVHAGDWLGAPLPTEPGDTALDRLVARYRAAHEPAEPADLAAWSGLPVRHLKRAWRPTTVDTRDAGPTVRLIPAFDEYLLGWRTRDHAVAPEHRKLVHPGGGIIRAAVLVDGRVAGTWTRAAGRVEVQPFEPLPDLTAEIDDLRRFDGK